MDMDIRALTEADADAFWALRLRALRAHPEAFGQSFEEALTTPIDRVARRLRDENSAPDNYILGAFDREGRLMGTVGLRRERLHKMRHKAFIWGMYAASEVRGRGVGRALLAAALDRARALPELEQVRLSVWAGSAAARTLYLSFGFEVYGLERRALKVGEGYTDEEHMALSLGGDAPCRAREKSKPATAVAWQRRALRRREIRAPFLPPTAVGVRCHATAVAGPGAPIIHEP